MKPIMNFIIFLTLVSISTKPHFMLAKTITPNIQPPNDLKGNEYDYEALLAIKDEISSDPNLVMGSWNNSLHLCQWKGVTCGGRHGRVVGLNLSSSNLVGTLSPFIGNLSFLQYLNLTNNSFRGVIPHQISYLPMLWNLSIAQNLLEGEIPTNLSHCLHLRLLDFHHNMLMGKIPKELVSNLPNLEIFDLSQNNLSGSLQDIGIGNMSESLKVISLYGNHLKGSIPNDVGRLKGLQSLSLQDNMLFGIIPKSLFNLSKLQVLALGFNSLHGHLPQDLGLRLPQLTLLSLLGNFLSERIPTSLSNLSKIEYLAIGYNNFNGMFSFNGNNMPHLIFFQIESAFSLGIEDRDLSFMNTLTNCTKLMFMEIARNSFTGTFPQSLLNFSTSLKVIDLSDNRIYGSIPFGLGKFVNVYFFRLDHNHLSGSIPHDIGMMKNVIYLSLFYNNLSGGIPISLGNMTFLSHLRMQYNNLEGSLPTSLGNCRNLQVLYLAYNKFSGVIPIELFQLSSLLALWIQQNNLQGSLSIEVSRLKNLLYLGISQNRFSGEIPSTIGACVGLAGLDMSKNAFVGSIPESLSSLKSIILLDLSCNHLSGQVPTFFPTWPYLKKLNLSFNDLEGEVPANGFFANTTIVSIIGNKKLCGGVAQLHLPICPLHKPLKKRGLSWKMVVFIAISCMLVMVLSLALCLYLCYTLKKRKSVASKLENIETFLEVSYQMLSMATNGFSHSNLIGVGGFGFVYKGTLQQGDTEVVVAVKVMSFQNERANKSFNAECKALRSIRHRNLVKIITVCSSIDTHNNNFKALVYEFMPKGSLESWLHSDVVIGEHVGNDQSCTLSLCQRLSIAIDVACALEYLHTECGNPIIHCDLKPSNILLDDEMIAHVGDFGLTKFLSEGSTSTTQVRGTVGYVAPEYGLGSKALTEGDMYSFGIIVLEMMTSKKPTDPMFIDSLNLHDFAKSALSKRVMEIIDQRMFGDENVMPAKNGADVKKIECCKLLVAIGVKCSVEIPSERMRIKDVVNELKSVRQNLIYIRYN